MTSSSGIDNATIIDVHDKLYDSSDVPELGQQESLLLQQPIATTAVTATTAEGADIELYPEQQRSQPSRLAQIAQQLTKRKIKAFIHHWRWYLLAGVVIAISSIFMYTHRRQFFQALESLSDTLSSMGYRLVGNMVQHVLNTLTPPSQRLRPHVRVDLYKCISSRPGLRHLSNSVWFYVWLFDWISHILFQRTDWSCCLLPVISQFYQGSCGAYIVQIPQFRSRGQCC